LVSLGFIDGSFLSLDSTSINANTAKNNFKSFDKTRFNKSIPPKSDKDCKLRVRTASNAYNEKKYEFYWGYKNHILVDAISGLPIAEITTTANVTDGEVAIPLSSPIKVMTSKISITLYVMNFMVNVLSLLTKEVLRRASINRDSDYFKSIYSLRTESERYNSIWKNLNTDKASVRNMSAIENLNTIGHICLLAVAFAAVKSGKTDCIKSLKNLKKSA